MRKEGLFVLAGVMMLGMSAVAYAAEQPFAEDDTHKVVSYDSPAFFTSEDFTASDNPSITLIGYGIEGEDSAYWNDWCAVGIEITVNGETSYKAVGGKQVSWAISFTDEKNEEVSADEIIAVDEDNCATVPLGNLQGDWSVKVRSMGWDNASDCPYIAVDLSNVGSIKNPSANTGDMEIEDEDNPSANTGDMEIEDNPSANTGDMEIEDEDNPSANTGDMEIEDEDNPNANTGDMEIEDNPNANTGDMEIEDEDKTYELKISDLIDPEDAEIVKNAEELNGMEYVMMDLKLYDQDGNRITTGFGKYNVQLSMKDDVFAPIKDASDITVYRVQDGQLVLIGKEKVVDDMLSFDTDHFSTYVFATKAAEGTTGNSENAAEGTTSNSENAAEGTTGNSENAAEGTTGNSENTGDISNTFILLLAVLGLSGAELVMSSKKKLFR